MNMGLMSGKRGLVMGVANDHSIAWGIAREMANAGAQLAFTYQGEAFGKRVKPLAESLGSDILLPCDVADPNGIANTFAELRTHWDSLDFVVHAVAYSDKEELKGRYLDTSRTNFAKTMAVSCYSFTEVAREAQPMMNNGGALLTLTYLGASRVTPNYNVMGVAKAALEASVRYLATDLGPKNIRVNAISAGPMRTLAGSAIANARFTYGWSRDQAPLNRSVELEEVGRAGLYLISDLAVGVTGEIHFVDCGYNLIGIPSPQRMTQDEVDKARTND
ncbi:enoyl-ACP reductase [Fodinicurvata halophila]|uniref:Enoyl-[acyl-carrier-protein] reductase [NADH] n=1 Tax=Fodinicurvata halophila TaxID=1419723 RepID=A0ABV8UGS6_9PROT